MWLVRVSLPPDYLVASSAVPELRQKLIGWLRRISPS